jgi:predicted secreted protein
MNHRMLAILAITAAALTGCSSTSEPASESGGQSAKQSQPHTETIQISYDELQKDKQISRSTTLAAGDFLQVSLASNPSTGFTWDEKLLISDPKVLAQTGHEAIAPKENRPGAAGNEVWMVQAMAPGNSTVSTSYGRPWEGGEKEAWVFSVNVTVK